MGSVRFGYEERKTRLFPATLPLVGLKSLVSVRPWNRKSSQMSHCKKQLYTIKK